MVEEIFTMEDLAQIEEHELSETEVNRQISLFEMSPPYLNLSGPACPGNGIRVFEEEQKKKFLKIYLEESPSRECLKFVPASGAASRMFKVLLKALSQDGVVTIGSVSRLVDSGDKDAAQLLDFMKRIRDFAFFSDLNACLKMQGLDGEILVDEGRFTESIECLLTDDGLGYANLPKGLLKFHQYPEGSRTPFEEHLVEAAAYVRNEDSTCFLHSTVSPEHMERFRNCLEGVRKLYEKKYHASFDVTFSIQKNATDTLAVDLNNRPFRQADGMLLFRPGGHGSLLQNLNDLEGDILFVKNIDNVVPDRLKPETFEWKKIMGGYLLFLQSRIFGFLKTLISGTVDVDFLESAESFLEKELMLPVPASVTSGSLDARKAYLIKRLDCPIRVCGMVKNAGEPGGGPFWVKDDDGEESFQIVETAQIDPDSTQQQDILSASTHFNPVDLVCGVRDWQGKPFDLPKFVDPNTFFVSEKSKDGRDLKALEHPGLWNGSMARWITVFVEVPGITFNPVKTVNDLLRNEHQP